MARGGSGYNPRGYALGLGIAVVIGIVGAFVGGGGRFAAMAVFGAVALAALGIGLAVTRRRDS